MALTAAIIGSGIGGLAAGIRLVRLGYQVTIYETLPYPGGKAAGVALEGHAIDSAPTVIRMPHLLAQVLKAGGKSLADIERATLLQTHYRIFKTPNHWLDIENNRANTTDNIAQFSSTDANRYEDFLERANLLYQQSFATSPEQNSEKPSVFASLKHKAASAVSTGSLMQEVQSYFSDDFIQQAFSFYPLFYGRNPYDDNPQSLLLHAIEQQWGILSVKDGLKTIIAEMVEVFDDLGGKIVLNSPVEQITLEKRKAVSLRLSSGLPKTYDAIISNLSPYTTQQLLDRSSMPQTPNRRLSSSFFLLHIVHDAAVDHLSLHNILTTHTYKDTMQLLFSKQRLPPDPWLYLYNPEIGNESLRSLLVLTPVPNLTAKIDWHKEVFPFRDTIVRKMESYLPGFSNHIIYEKATTPLHFRDQYDLPAGSILFPPVKAAYDNLYYVGDNTWNGLGMIAALSSAEQVAKEIAVQNPI
ncbi:MAG TPA: phytoene desaturase [Chloroflexi bacterium]|nr:phytoene desaturase [Chloroflexota bacterium]